MKNIDTSILSSVLTTLDKVVKKPDSKKESKKSAMDNYLAPKYLDLLNAIEYFPDGNAPREHNVFSPIANKPCKWYLSDKKVAIINENKVVEIADNALDRLEKSVSYKFSLERDWLPTYKISEDDNFQEVALAILESKVNGEKVEQIPKKLFGVLDNYYKSGKPDDHKTMELEEVNNDAMRYIIAKLFTDNAGYLPKLVAENGSEIARPTYDALEEDDEEIYKFLKPLFDNVRNKHSSASLETWLSAMCYSIHMPTKDAIRYIFGDASVGKKKYHKCAVEYSRRKNQVFEWLFQEVTENPVTAGTKLEKCFGRIYYTKMAEKFLGFCDKYGVFRSDDEQIHIKLTDMIAINPEKAYDLLISIISEYDTEDVLDDFSTEEEFADIVGKYFAVANKIVDEIAEENNPF